MSEYFIIIKTSSHDKTFFKSFTLFLEIFIIDLLKEKVYHLNTKWEIDVLC